MAVSVIDTRGEFKLVPYSGDDEHWPQWVLKFKAWSELVGWGRQLDAASQSTRPIANTTLEADVQTISRQLYAIFVVKLEGKALGIVQLLNKGEGLEAWRQLKLEYEGKSGNRQASFLRGILNPRAAWEADTRDGRSVVESLNRWEKTERSGHLRWYLGSYSTGTLAYQLPKHPEASPFQCASIVQRNAWLVT